MIHGEPPITSVTMRTPKASASALLVLSASSAPKDWAGRT
jgi:hypothetical protein